MGVYRYSITSDAREMEDDAGMDDYVVAKYIFAFKYWYCSPSDGYLKMEKRKLKSAENIWDAMKIKPNCEVDKFSAGMPVKALPDHVKSGYDEEHAGPHIGFLRRRPCEKKFYIDTENVPIANWTGSGYRVIFWISKGVLGQNYTQPITVPNKDMLGDSVVKFIKSGRMWHWLRKENIYPYKKKDPISFKDQDFSHLIPSLKIPSLKKEDKYKLISDKLNIGIS